MYRPTTTKQKKKKHAPAKPNDASKADLAHLVAVLVDQLRHGVVLLAVRPSAAPAAERPSALDHVAEARAGPESAAVHERRHPEARVSDLHVGRGPDALGVAKPDVGGRRGRGATGWCVEIRASERVQ